MQRNFGQRSERGTVRGIHIRKGTFRRQAFVFDTQDQQVGRIEFDGDFFYAVINIVRPVPSRRVPFGLSERPPNGTPDDG